MNCKLTGNGFLLIILFVFFVAMPAIAGIFTDSKGRQQIERRKLAPIPELHVFLDNPRRFFSDTDAYLGDHFGLSELINRVYRNTQWYIFRNGVHPQIVRAKTGGIFFLGKGSHHIQILCNQGDEFSIQKNIEAAQTIHNYFAENNRYVSFLIAPSKIGLYPELLPDSIRADWRSNCRRYAHASPLFRFIELLREKSVQIVYPYAEFMAEKNDPHFYPVENYHWKGASTHLAAMTLFKELNIEVPKSTPRRLLAGKGDLENIFGFPRDVEYYDYNNTATKSKKESHLFLKDIKRFFRRYPDFGVWANETKSGRRALLITNSFGPYVAPYLGAGFNRVYSVSTNQLKRRSNRTFYKWLASLDVTDIIFVFHDIAILQDRLVKIANYLK